MNKTIHISKPYIIEDNKSIIFGKSVKLCSNIKMVNPNTNILEEKICYFEFEKKYKKYITVGRSDAFVMGLLSTAMENGYDIEYEEPLSSRLYYQLTEYYIPMVSSNNRDYPMNNIRLIGPRDNRIIENEHKVATGCSGGVDSFYTISRHTKDDMDKEYKLTHIVYSSSGTDDLNKERIIKKYIIDYKKMIKLSKDCNIECIGCFNNLYEFYKYPFKAFITFFTTTFSSVAFALQKLLSVYYVSSGDSIKEFNLNLRKTHGHDSSVFDIFTTSMITNENLSFYTSGANLERIEKEEYISNIKASHNNLIVCAAERYYDKELKYSNCSLCPKCLRTMTQFYVLGKLDLYKNSFDIVNYYKHKTKYIAQMMAYNKRTYVKDMIKYSRKNHQKIPFQSYLLYCLIYKPFYIIRKLLKKSLLLRKIYYKLNLDIKVNGYRSSNYDFYMGNKNDTDKQV